MPDLLDVDTVALDVLGYPLSYLEMVGTVLYLASVVLIARRQILTWPVGIVAVVLYAALFWQIRLYADAMEQVYYLGASVYGWWHWSRTSSRLRTAGSGGSARSPRVPVAYGSRGALFGAAGLTVAFSAALGAALTRVHVWWPAAFPEPADYPWVDATTTVMSLVAMWLMARRRVESWVYWTLVDVAGVWLYFVKGVWFVALLYVVLLVLALVGLRAWHRARGDARSRPPGGPG